MSLYKNDITIGGVPCGMVLRGTENGCYIAIFEREAASLEDIESICWDQPEITGTTLLPAGAGFRVTDIRYSYTESCYKVEVQMETQYLGDVAGYQAEISALESELAAAQETAAALNIQIETLTAQISEAEGRTETAESQADEEEAPASQTPEGADDQKGAEDNG